MQVYNTPAFLGEVPEWCEEAFCDLEEGSDPEYCDTSDVDDEMEMCNQPAVDTPGLCCDTIGRPCENNCNR